jgi:hypothetical protein
MMALMLHLFIYSLAFGIKLYSCIRVRTYSKWQAQQQAHVYLSSLFSTECPTASPSLSPTASHKANPTASPSLSPTASPTASPSLSPLASHGIGYDMGMAEKVVDYRKIHNIHYLLVFIGNWTYIYCTSVSRLDHFYHLVRRNYQVSFVPHYLQLATGPSLGHV